MQPFISIIVPVYNVEKYLPKCLESIVNQTYKDIEIICINDGSTDKSPLILEEYAKKDERIKLINQENKGVAISRNEGIENSSGKYLMFVDSDDWLDIDACKKLYEYSQNNDADVISFNFYSQTKTTLRKIKIPYDKNAKFSIQEWGHWNRLYKSDFIKNNDIRYPENLKIGEDVVFLSKALLNKPKSDYVNEYLYYYLADRGGSATKDYSKSLELHLNSYEYLKRLDIYKNAADEDKLYIADLWARSVFNLWSNLPHKYKTKENEKLINLFLKEISKFEYFNKTETKGYKRLKYRKIVGFLKSIRNLYFKITKRG